MKKEIKDAMLDIETLGSGRNACMVQVGACYFDRYTGQVSECLKINLDARELVKMGAELDADTVYWWLSQEKPAQKSICEEPRTDIRAALLELDIFLKDADAIWSHATFDYPIVQETFKRAGLKPSFRYSAARDIRTLQDLSGAKIKPEREGTHHDALDDCKFQVKYCVEAFKALVK